MEDKLNVSILDSFSKVDEKNIDQKLKEALQSFHKKIVVLDDDPTGVQTVQDVYKRQQLRSVLTMNVSW